MDTNESKKQALRFNAIRFYGSSILAVIFAALTGYILVQSPAMHSSTSSGLAWPNLLPRGLLPFSGCVFFLRQTRTCQQAALEMWDRQRANDRIKKDTKSAVRDLPNSQSALRSTPIPSQSIQTSTQKTTTRWNRIEERRMIWPPKSFTLAPKRNCIITL